MIFDALIAKYRLKGIVIDTNLLVLLAVGGYREDRIRTFNRTRQYSPRDFSLLVQLIDTFARRIVTPHIVAEADNLTRQLPQREHQAVANAMARIITQCCEIYFPSIDAANSERYALLGVTDCTIAAASEDALVITDDAKLVSVLSHLGRDTININHIRILD